VVCGRRFFAGVPVVLWTSEPAYDASSEHARFGPDATGEGAPKGLRYQPGRVEKGSPPVVRVDPESEEIERLREVVDQFVIHYDAAGSSRKCFEILQDKRGLSVHFMLDVDGTIYQTLDLRDQAWHATKANPRSIGVEVANLGIPEGGEKQPAFTDAQYASLAKLAAALCTVFPRIAPDAPRDAEGRIVAGALDAAAFASFHGILGHSHVQSNKQDPGPAFDWDRFLADVRANLGR
jgi:N-acetyl-anhydromuramyl-L-alanine amidase AmpD